jgi:hypothetical protein
VEPHVNCDGVKYCAGNLQNRKTILSNITSMQNSGMRTSAKYSIEFSIDDGVTALSPTTNPPSRFECMWSMHEQASLDHDRKRKTTAMRDESLQTKMHLLKLHLRKRTNDSKILHTQAA